MSARAFPAHIEAALDRLTVPPVPAGFSDRLLARIHAGDLPEASDLSSTPLPDLRRPVHVTGWRRSGRIVTVAAAFGLATATAAASGVFGEAVYVPIVSDALAKADLVTLPKKDPSAKKPVVASKATAELPPAEQVPEPVGKDLVIQKIEELRKDPAYRALSREQKLARFKAEMADLESSGKVTKADIRAARQQLLEARGDARSEQNLPLREKRIAEARKREGHPVPKPMSPEQKDKLRDAYAQLSETQKAELRILRQRRRDASPEERRAIAREIRAFWQRVGVKPIGVETDPKAVGGTS